MLIDVVLPVLLALGHPFPIPAATLPVEVASAASHPGELELALRPLAVTELSERTRVTLAGFPRSGGATLDLELERLDTARLGFGLRIDGADAAGLLESLELSVWHGRVAGRADSEVALSFSQAGVHGWLRVGEELEHLVSRGDGRIEEFSEQRRLERGGAVRPGCASVATPAELRSRRAAPSSLVQAGPFEALYTCKIAVETDWQFLQVFGGNLAAEVAYVTSLLTWTSYRFQQQIGTLLTYPYVQFYSTSNDPWVAQDNGGNCLDLLAEFRAAWIGNLPAGADLAHFLSGANLGCGAAYIGGLCDPARNFGVTGNMDGNNQFPIQVGPSNFNFYGVTHELGHNFNAIHTHDYCPPIDQCAPAGWYGPCQTQRVCTNQGTLMSYCHGCPGGFTNITTFFHPQSVADMRAWVVAGCLPH
jgi:Metallo-peptidase family M12